MILTGLARVLGKRGLAGLYLEALMEMAWCKVLTVFVPFGRWAHRQGRFQSETLKDDRSAELPRIQAIRGAILRIARRAPWRSKCLDQALVMQRMLARRGLPSTTYYGMKRDASGNWIAHAWVRCGSIWAIGYQHGEEYTVVGAYARL